VVAITAVSFWFLLEGEGEVHAVYGALYARRGVSLGMVVRLASGRTRCPGRPGEAHGPVTPRGVAMWRAPPLAA